MILTAILVIIGLLLATWVINALITILSSFIFWQGLFELCVILIVITPIVLFLAWMFP